MSKNSPTLQALHRELGIPADYAATFHLELVAEASPEELRLIASVPHEIRLLAPPAHAWAMMHIAAAANQISLLPVSGFRSVCYQAELIRAKLRRGTSIDEILRVNMAPGFSEHHSGRALDVTTTGEKPLSERFAATPAFAWLSEHAGAFGFSLSYPRGNPQGIAYEPWHWCWTAPSMS